MMGGVMADHVTQAVGSVGCNLIRTEFGLHDTSANKAGACPSFVSSSAGVLAGASA